MQSGDISEKRIPAWNDLRAEHSTIEDPVHSRDCRRYQWNLHSHFELHGETAIDRGECICQAACYGSECTPLQDQLISEPSRMLKQTYIEFHIDMGRRLDYCRKGSMTKCRIRKPLT
jgi:hypothetical protein